MSSCRAARMNLQILCASAAESKSSQITSSFVRLAFRMPPSVEGICTTP